MRFVLAYGIHRKLLGVVWLALGLGGLVGALLHARFAGASSGHPSLGWLCAACAVLAFSWPLSWMATFRVIRPLRELATVASDLQKGRLERRVALVSEAGEVGEVSEALRSVADRLARQLEDQKALMATVSHELRSPLARVQVLVDMAREGSAPPSLPDEIEREIRAMDQLVGDLLAAARIDFEAVRPRALSLRDVLERAIEMARVTATLPDTDPGWVSADPTLLTRAVSLLLDNAQRHGGSTISLQVQDRGDLARICVLDDGQGFTPDELLHLFEPFWRGASPEGRPKPSGAGLGLSLVRRIARAHGGEAGAENAPQGGSIVWLEVPKAQVREAASPGWGRGGGRPPA